MCYSYSERLSLDAFLNALLNEWQGYIKTENEIIIPGESGELILPLLQDSIIKRFRFYYPVKLRRRGRESSVDYQGIIDFICQNRAITGDFSFAQLDCFKEQVFASQQHIDSVLATRTAAMGVDGFLQAEQSLIGGHDLHPAGKSHQFWSSLQTQLYGPDHACAFALHWFYVHPQLLIGDSFCESRNGDSRNGESRNGESGDQLGALLLQSYQDAGITRPVPDGYLPLPVHPHQARVLVDNTSIQQYIADGLMVSAGVQGRDWHPTSSTRALWQAESRWMLKFSLSVKLTNSLRHLSVQELSRGVLFRRISDELAVAELRQRFPEFDVLQEPAWCGLRDLAGEPITGSLFCWRENPFPTGKEPSVALATLTQLKPDGSNYIQDLVAKVARQNAISPVAAALIWFERFLEFVIKPICVARSDYGLVLLAHQQNILVTLSDGLPAGAKFRDCQGTGYTETALQRFTLLQQEKPEYFADNESVNPYFSYYLVVNSLNSVIAALLVKPGVNQCSADVEEELNSADLIRLSQELWIKLRQHRFYDSSLYDYLLNSDTLKIKGNFFCFLSTQNETELTDPSRIYLDTPNPFRLDDSPSRTIVFRPLLTSPAAALQLVIRDGGTDGERQHGTFKVSTCMDEWQFTYAEKTGLVCHQSSSRMNRQQWFSVLEHLFAGTQHDAVIITQEQWQKAADVPLPTWAQCSDEQIIITRSRFFQQADIWSHPTRLAEDDQRTCISDKGIHYPLRPPQPKGIWFQKYLYELDRVISFRCADIQRDLALFHYWHNRPDVDRMWDLAGTKQAHRDYLVKQTRDPHSMPVIGYFDGVPFGYFEVYWTPEDRLGVHYDCQPYDRGVHMLVGNPAFRGGEFFVNWAVSLQHAIFLDDERTQHVMGEPRADNLHVVKISASVGLKKLKEFDFPHKRAALLCSERAHFFGEII